MRALRKSTARGNKSFSSVFVHSMSIYSFFPLLLSVHSFEKQKSSDFDSSAICIIQRKSNQLLAKTICIFFVNKCPFHCVLGIDNPNSSDNEYVFAFILFLNRTDNAHKSRTQPVISWLFFHYCVHLLHTIAERIWPKFELIIIVFIYI